MTPVIKPLTNLLIVLSILFVLIVTGCGKDNTPAPVTLTFCGESVVVQPPNDGTGHTYPASIISMPDGKFKKFCGYKTTGDATSGVDTWRGGYRNLAKPTCGFWGNQVTSDINLSLDTDNSRTTDCN